MIDGLGPAGSGNPSNSDLLCFVGRWIGRLNKPPLWTGVEGRCGEVAGLSCVIDALFMHAHTQGVRGFFRGLSTSLLRAFPVNAVTFLGYEAVLKLAHSQVCSAVLGDG